MNLVFETQRLLLKPITPADLETLHAIFVDPYVRKYLADDTILPKQQVAEMLAENQTLFDEQQVGLWFIETKDKPEIIGFVGLWYFFDEEQPQLVYALLPDATQQGYATEAASKIIDYCFNTLGYSHLIASADKPNVASHKVATRLGMHFVEERTINGNPLVFFRIDTANSNYTGHGS